QDILTVDQILSEYLSPHILSVEHIEMAQCLYFNAVLTNMTIISSDDKNETSCEYYDNKKEAVDQKNVVFSNKGSSQAQQNQTISLIPQQFTVSPSITTSSQCITTQRFKFCKLWDLV
ncbi:9319_t:CDS:2, partial [Racocetra persica]